MMKNKMTARAVSHKELVADLGKERADRLAEDVKNIKFASKKNIEIFGGSYSSIPLPLHLLKCKLSKDVQHQISELVAMVVNEKMGHCARTVQYLNSIPKNHPKAKLILKNSKWVSKRGKEQGKAFEAFWKRKEKFKKHELFRISLGL